MLTILKKLLPVVLALVPLDEAKQLTFRGDYEASAAILKNIKPDRESEPLYHFLAAVNAFKTNNKKEAARQLEYIEDSFSDVPLRYLSLANLMREDLKFWQENDLGDIARDFDHISKRLDNLKGGPQTQAFQKQALEKLERLIKEKEDEANKPQGDKKPGSKEQREAGDPITPQHDSMPGSESGPGKVDNKQFKKLVEGWGKLPEKERIRAMQNMTRDLPPRYKMLIEEYFKKLAENK